MGKLNGGMKACGILLLWATAAVALPAQTFTSLHSFDYTDGGEPIGTLLQATNGKLFGTTYTGGANVLGTVFTITPTGTFTNLHNFCSLTNCTDGAESSAGLVQGTNGSFYGTTAGGGLGGFYGTVFKITANGALTTLHEFDATDGVDPVAGLTLGTNGQFYGSTSDGGANFYGTIFKITAAGALTTLHNFAGTDGGDPYGTLVQGADGKFYGTALGNGAHNGGTVFKITAAGALTTIYNFCAKPACADGQYPYGGLVQGTDGNFYGTTRAGGANDYGTVFKITPAGKITILHSFAGADGSSPTYGALIQAADGNFYGTTFEGGVNSDSVGTIYSITPAGVLTTLYSFCSQTDCTDGSYPEGGLVQDTNGTFYGTTSSGGTSNYGTVFSLSVGLKPFVITQPTSGTVGAAVKILGTSLTGSTSVKFNGTAATFTVVSSSEITTTVPAGATSGTVSVVTPGGTRLTNVPFTVN